MSHNQSFQYRKIILHFLQVNSISSLFTWFYTHNSQINYRTKIIIISMQPDPTSPEQLLVSFSIMYKLHTLLRRSYLYRRTVRTHTCSHRSAVSVCVFKTQRKAQRTHQYIHTSFSKREPLWHKTHVQPSWLYWPHHYCNMCPKWTQLMVSFEIILL